MNRRRQIVERAAKTPNIDRLAANGMRFENAYAHPLCTPSRVALLTGQYNFRNYTSFGELRLSVKTFGNMLRDAGYRTAMVGKWQLCKGDFQAPFHFGLAEYLLWNFGMRVNGVPTPGVARLAVPSGTRSFIPASAKLLPNTKGQFGPDVMADFVEDYIQKHQTGQFFLSYPLVLPHDPWIERPGWLGTGDFPREFGPADGQRGNPLGAKDIEERRAATLCRDGRVRRQAGRARHCSTRWLETSAKRQWLFSRATTAPFRRCVPRLMGARCMATKAGRPTLARTCR